MPITLEKVAEATVGGPKRKEVPTKKIIRFVVKVAEFMLGFRGGFYEYQVEFCYRIVESLLLRDGETVTGLFSRQSGKSTAIGAISDSCAVSLPWLANLPRFKDDPRLNLVDERGNYRGFAQGINVGVYAPKREQAQLTYGKMTNTLETGESIDILDELGIVFDQFNGTTLNLSNGSLEFAGTASEQAKIEGPNYHLMILEEAQDISQRQAREGLMPMVAAHNGTVIQIGTCTVQKSDFYEAIKDNEREERTGGIQNHFFYPHFICEKYNSLYKKHVNKMKRKWGEDSDEFRLKYKCEWLLERGMFCTPEVLYGSATRSGCAVTMGKFANIHPKGLRNFDVVAAVDLGKRLDSTVVTAIAVDWNSPIVRETVEIDETMVEVALFRKHVVGWLEFNGDDYSEQFPGIVEYLRHWRHLRKIVIDSTGGVGDVAIEHFTLIFGDHDVEIIPFVFSLAQKGEGYKLLHMDMNMGRFTFPSGPDARETRHYRNFTEQMLNLEKNYKGQHMSCAAPDEPDAHDDYPDSAMMANWGASAPAMVPEVTESLLF